MKLHETAALITAIILFGGTVVAILKGFFQTKKGCENVQKECSSHICGKIDKMEEKRDSARLEFAETLRKIATHMGSVEQYMKDHP